jgi:U3 small nucleolar RNA-associated protein 4
MKASSSALWFPEVRTSLQGFDSELTCCFTGIDTQPIIVPLGQYGKELSRGLPSLPPTPPLTSAPDARLLVSWWNTEVRVWRVKPKEDGPEQPKVVARLALQGEENITSASISQDGGLLAVSTTSTVKLFQLIRLQAGAGASLRIRKVDMPAVAGTTSVRLSANGKWLSAISATNEIQLVRIVRTDDESDPPRVLNKLQHLHRLDRSDIPNMQLRGASGFYARSIAHADFSRDANVFAVVDIAGYVDTWVIEGHEDSTAPEIDIDEAAPAVTDDDDSDDEETEEREQIIFLGQHWIRNPSAHLIPRLHSTPVLLSFQPSADNDDSQPNGNPAVHPTRHNPHPHSHELPTKEYRLLLVSAQHQLYLFDIMTGRLSDWSRRNPPSSYPLEYLQLDLPAKGCVWDVSEAKQRVWLYGEKWLFMFDLTKDFSISGDNAALSKKRKWNAHKKNSGAGGAIPQSELPVAKMRKFESSKSIEAGKAQWQDIEANGAVNTDDDDELDGNSQPLAILRRGSTQDGEQMNGVVTNVEEDGGEVKRSEPWWHTFKYRPILGILPVGDSAGETPEVVVVERPSWDLELPPRFVGSHEK